MVRTCPNRWSKAGKSRSSERDAARRPGPKWRLVTLATSEKGPLWKFTGPRRQRGPKKKLNTTKIREARRTLQDRLGSSGPARMKARETLKELDMEPEDTSSEDTDDSEPESDSSRARNGETSAQSSDSSTEEQDLAPFQGSTEGWNGQAKRRSEQTPKDANTGLEAVRDRMERIGMRCVAWEPPSRQFRQLRVYHCHIWGDRLLTYQEGSGWIEHTDWPMDQEYRPASPPGSNLGTWTSIKDPFHNWEDMATLREKAIATVAICVRKKKDLDLLPVPESLKKEVRCWHHRYYPEEHEGKVRFNTGECSSCCRSRCAACCCKFSRTRIQHLPSPPAAED